METYPEYLPLPLQSASSTPLTAVRRQVMESGRSRQYKAYSKIYKNLGLQFKMTEEEFYLFKDWHHRNIKNGADSFYLKLKNGGGLQTNIVRMIEGMFTASFIDPHWTISFSIEISNPIIIPEAIFDILNEIGGIKELEDVTGSLHNLVHHVMPQVLPA